MSGDYNAEFTQAENHNQQKFGGTGLGLSISRCLTKLMGGEISVTSQPGKGSTFTISLNNVDVAALTAHDSHQPTQISADVVQFSPAVVMVVDDIANNRQLIKENFAPTALSIIEAENGRQAINKASEHAIDLILMDLRMPVLDGYLAAEKIKKFKNTPIIAITASVMRDEHQRTKSENFNGYLQKPVLRKDLFRELGRFLEHQIIDEQKSQPASTVVLSEQQQKVLPEVLLKLKQHTEQWQIIQDSNNISAMKKFAHNLAETGVLYDFKPVIDYAQQLNERIRIFDTQGINNNSNTFQACRLNY